MDYQKKYWIVIDNSLKVDFNNFADKWDIDTGGIYTFDGGYYLTPDGSFPGQFLAITTPINTDTPLSIPEMSVIDGKTQEEIIQYVAGLPQYASKFLLFDCATHPRLQDVLTATGLNIAVDPALITEITG